MSLYTGRIQGMQYEQSLRREQDAKKAMRDQMQQQAQAQGLAAQAQVMQAQQARENALEPERQARTAEMLGQGLSVAPQKAPVTPPKKVMELADFVSSVSKGNTRQAEVDSGFVRPGSTRKNADGSLSFVSHEGEEVTLPKAVVDQGLGLRQQVPRSPLEEEYLRERIEKTRTDTEIKRNPPPKALIGTEKAKAGEALTRWQMAQKEYDDLLERGKPGFFQTKSGYAKELADAKVLADSQKAAYDMYGVPDNNPISTTPVNPNAPGQSPMARESAKGKLADKNMVRDFLKQAGGDKVKAEALAKAAGYEF